MSEDIVISGIAGRYPGCDSIDELRDKLFNNKDLITEDESRWPPGLYGLPRRHGKLSNIDKFDAQFFGIHGKQVNAMDPQLRVLLETTYEAILDSGTSIKSLVGSRTGVFVGASSSQTFGGLLSRAPDVSGFALPGCDTSMFANRISYHLDIKGPSYAINTACSSSATGLHQAILNMRAGVCDAAIVGGVLVNLHPGMSITFNEMHMLSPDGKCKFLDESANGYVRSEACSVIFLQKSSQAKRIYATVVSTSANTDGHKKQGITYPSSEVQSLLMRSTLESANVSPNRVSYIEAHGTGTQVGDQCEMEAIAKAYCEHRSAPLLVGSVKTNLGHSEPASALTSIAKVVIAFENNCIPASIHFTRPNPNIKALTSGLIRPITENTGLGDNAIVGINSFGFGGANVHILLAPNGKVSAEDDYRFAEVIPRIIPLFGRTEDSIKYLIASIEKKCDRINREMLSLLDAVKDTPAMPFRSYLLANRDVSTNRITFETEPRIERVPEKRPLWFIFSGMGSQWPGIAKGLMNLNIFRESLLKSNEVLKEFGFDLIEVLNDESNAIDDTINSFVAITATQIAFIDLFRALDITPDGFVGHSLGEVACGYCDGGIDHKQTIIATYWRARIVKEAVLPKGLMAAVGLSWEECRQRCPESVYPACHNSEDSVTISGEFEATNKFVKQLKDENVFAKEVNSCGAAFHCPIIQTLSQPMLKKNNEIIREKKCRSSKWISSSVPESEWNTDLGKYCSAEYYENNMSSPVLFHEALQHVPRNAVVIELAPHSLLQAIIKRSLGPDITYVPLMRRNNSSGNLQMILSAIGRLYQLGFNPDIGKLYPEVSYPVSRGTPSLSPLIKWDHSDDWSVTRYPDYFNSTNTSEYKVTIDLDRSEDAFYADHNIDGQILFPAAGYFALVWQMMAKSQGKALEECPIEFNDIKILRATILKKPRQTVFTIQMGHNGQFFLKNNNNVVFTGRVAIIDGMADQDLSQIRRSQNDCQTMANTIKFNGNEFYKECRIRGYDYGEEFRLIRETSIDGIASKIVFNGNWVAFLDNVFQTKIMTQKDRWNWVPVSYQSVKCDPRIFTQKVNSSQAVEVDVFFDPTVDLMSVETFLMVKGLKIQLAHRKSRPCNLEKYQFVTHDQDIIDDKLDHFIRSSNRLTKSIVDGLRSVGNTFPEVFRSEQPLIRDDQVELGQSRNYKMISLLENHLTSQIDLIKILNDSLPPIDYDMLAIDQIYSSESVIRPLIDITIENCSSGSLNILEMAYTDRNCLIPAINSLIEHSALNVSASYKLALLTEEVIESERVVDIEVIDCKRSPVRDWAHLTVFKHPIAWPSQVEIQAVIKSLYDSIRESGFALIIVRTGLTPLDRVVHHLLGKQSDQIIASNSVHVITAEARRMGFVSIAERRYRDLFSAVLLRKVKQISAENQTIVHISNHKYEQWIDTLILKLRECQTRPEGHNLWLVASDSPHNGIIGLVNCLRREPGGERVRCLFLGRALNTDFNQSQYSELFAKDLVMNVIVDQQLGSYRHFTCNEELNVINDQCLHAYLNVAKRGDLSSIKWFESEHKFWPVGQKSDQELINVYYSALNFRDIMLSTGKLSASALPGDLAFQKCVLGMEFAGRDQSGRRVVGMVPAKALATTVVVNSCDYLWSIPDHWSMEEACTVPVAYSTAYYALVIRGRMRKGETVLIHSGSGAVGQAAIHIALSTGCQVFTTVGNHDKRQYLASMFPSLEASRFADSHDTSFETHVMKETRGRGVDLVLNSLAEDKLQASVRCLAQHGRFLEIGKYDLSMDSPLGMSAFLKNIEFHGILLDALFEDSVRVESDKNQLRQFISDGISSGAIRPLTSTTFDANDAEQAFRYMASGKHMGKVVVQIRTEESKFIAIPQPSRVRALTSTVFWPNKSYIIIGGLGGFGLELLQWMVEKGARNLVISSRSGVKNNYQKFILARVQQMSAEVVVNNYDISCETEAKKLVDLAQSIGPLGGIFNVAMVLSDGLFDRQSAQRFEMVCKPKVTITEHMDAISREKCPDLDFFVVFSSLACGRGNAGQTNYGFANSSMERICESRRMNGLHGLAIQWGAIGDVGVVAENMGGNDIEIAGLVPQRVHSCLQALDRFLQSNEAVLSSFVKSVHKEEKVSDKKIDLITRICKILGIKDHSTLSPNTTLADMGMDSLMSTEIRQTMAMEGYDLSQQELRNITVNRLKQISDQNMAKL